MRIETLTLGEVKPPSRSHTTEKGGAPGFRPKSVRLQNVVASSRGGDGPGTPHAFAHSLSRLHPVFGLVSGFAFGQPLALGGVRGVSVCVLGDGAVSAPTLSS